MSSSLRADPPPPRPPAWFVDGLLLAVVIAPAFLPFLRAELRPDTPLAWIGASLPAVLLLLRRRAPIPTLIALVLLFIVAVVSGTLLPGGGVAVAATVFVIAKTQPRRQSLLIAASTLIVMAIAAAAGALMLGLDPLVFQFVVVVAFAAAMGDAIRSRRQYLAAVTERAERAERTRESEARRRVSEERLRIARDLHDAVAHQISVISLNAGVASSTLENDPERTRAALRTIREASRSVLGEIGDLLAMLRTVENDDAPSLMVQYGIEDLDALIAQFEASGLEVHQRRDGEISLNGSAGLVAYRVVQEALTNAHKHGSEHRAHLLIDASSVEELRIVVSNPFDHDEPADFAMAGSSGTGLGMIGLRERILSVRGTVEIGPAPGGWRVDATIPLHQKGRP